MKKAVLLFAMLITLSTNIFAQETVERKTLFKSKLGYEITQLIRSSGTTTYFYYSYRNQKYRHITDLGSVFISDKEELKVFAEKLIEFSNKEKGIEAKTADWCAETVVYGSEYKAFGFTTAESLETKKSTKWLIKETDEYKATYVAVKIKSYSIRTVAKCVSEYLAHESTQQ